MPTSGEFCYGRDATLKELSDIWSERTKNVVSIVARGGEGKTTLIEHWLRELSSDAFRGAERVFARSFYSQGTSDRAASADKIIDEALRFFGESNPEQFSHRERGVVLARLIGQGRNLFVLDGMEPLQYPPGEMEGEVKDPALEALLKGLLLQNAGLCAITTREEIKPLKGGNRHKQFDLQRLPLEAARRLIKQLGVKGDQKAIDRAIEENQGHALAVTLLGTYLTERFDGDVANVANLSQPQGFDGEQALQVELLKGRERESWHARKMIASYEKWFQDEPDEVNSAALSIIRTMGLFNRPPESGCMAALREEPVDGLTEALFAGDAEETWRRAVLRLHKARLVERDATDWNRLDCHPLIREYFSEALAQRFPDATKKAHAVLYRHLQTVPGEHRPKTIKSLMPLFHAVWHGCRAGEGDDAFSNVLMERIRHGKNDTFYTFHNLGAFGLELATLGSFFVRPWQVPAEGLTDWTQALVLSNVGWALRGLGKRMSECLEPMREAKRKFVEMGIWNEASGCASNVSQMNLSMGRIDDAWHEAMTCIELAERAEPNASALMRVVARTQLGRVLSAMGYTREACSAYQDAQDRQSTQYHSPPPSSQWKPPSPMLTGTSGLDFWNVQLSLNPSAEDQIWNQVSSTLANEELNQRLADNASHHLISARILTDRGERGASGDSTEWVAEAARQSLVSVETFREAQAIHDLPQGLLAIARIERIKYSLGLDDSPEKAIAAIDEVDEIARRSEMLIWHVEAAIERASISLETFLVTGELAQLTLAENQLKDAREFVAVTESELVPYRPYEDSWAAPYYAEAATNAETVGYHCRNRNIDTLQQRIAELR